MEGKRDSNERSRGFCVVRSRARGVLTRPRYYVAGWRPLNAHELFKQRFRAGLTVTTYPELLHGFLQAKIVRDFPSLATRESGAAARQLVLERLREVTPVVIDFTGAHPTPSFADEFLGRLAEAPGEATFRASIRVQGADAETRL